MKIKFIKLCLLILIIFLAVPAFSQDRVVDNAGLLSEAEKASLMDIITVLSSHYNFDLVIVTEKNIGFMSPSEEQVKKYADDFFDKNGYGMGPNRDGCLFLQVTDSRDFWISTTGRAVKILNSAALQKVEADAVKFLQTGNTYGAYWSFLNNWETFLELNAKGRSYNVIQEWHFVILAIAWALAIAIGFLVVFSWKKKMDTALPQTQAAAYIVPGSLSFTVKNDSFL